MSLIDWDPWFVFFGGVFVVVAILWFVSGKVKSKKVERFLDRVVDFLQDLVGV